MPISWDQIGVALASGSALVVGAAGGLKKMGLLKLGRAKASSNSDSKCPDHDCQEVVTKTHFEIGEMRKDYSKMNRALFGDDGTGGMTKTLHRVEFCVEALAKKEGIKTD